MLLILSYNEKSIQGSFGMGNLYNLVVIYAFDFHGLADKPIDSF